ncbi:MAG TPA: iron ABC transporter permease, partial [Pseudomonas sp.]|nr:iron ABC transporter permease [Pseudomonas sp.]
MPVRSTAAYRLLILGLSVGLVLSCIGALAFGPATIPLANVWGILGKQLGVDPVGEWSRSQESIVWL